MNVAEYKARMQQKKQNLLLPEIPRYRQLTEQLFNALQGDVVYDLMKRIGADKMDDRQLRIRMEGENLKVSKKVTPHLYELLNGVMQTLNFEHPVDFFIVSSASLNAGAYCYTPLDPDSPYIVQINSALIDVMTEKELCSVVGHELGHLADENMFLKDIINFVFPPDPQTGMPNLPLPLRFKFFLWKQMSELFADRYGYLAVKDLDACISSEFKIKSGLKLDKMEVNIPAFIEENRKILNHYINGKGLSLNDGYTHPVSPIRIEALNLFANARTEKELTDGMNVLIDAITRLNTEEIEDHMLYFMASAGLIMANADGQVTQDEIDSILLSMSNYYMFPMTILEQVNQADCYKIFNESVKNILGINPNMKGELFSYIVNLMLADHKFDQKEIDLMFQIGRQTFGFDENDILCFLTEGIRQAFVPSITSIS